MLLGTWIRGCNKGPSLLKFRLIIEGVRDTWWMESCYSFIQEPEGFSGAETFWVSAGCSGLHAIHKEVPLEFRGHLPLQEELCQGHWANHKETVVLWFPLLSNELTLHCIRLEELWIDYLPAPWKALEVTVWLIKVATLETVEQMESRLRGTRLVPQVPRVWRWRASGHHGWALRFLFSRVIQGCIACATKENIPFRWSPHSSHHVLWTWAYLPSGVWKERLNAHLLV